MPETPNHGYNVPSEGAEDWHVPLNENFEQYDTDIEIRDTNANKGNYEPKTGAKFFATDTGNVYLGDGSDWVPQPTTGKNPRVEDLQADKGVSAQRIRASEGRFERVAATGFVRGDSVGVGRSPSRPLDVAGGNNWNLDDNDGDLRIGDDDFRLAIGVSLGGAGRGTARLRAKGGKEKLALQGGSDTSLTVDGDEHLVSVGSTDPSAVSNNELFGIRSTSGLWGGMYIDSVDVAEGRPFYGYSVDGEWQSAHYHDADDGKWKLAVGQTLGVLSVDEKGNLEAFGTKNFVQQVDTDDGEKEVVYTATEADTPSTETSGVAELEGGRAEVDLPDHFGWVTSDEDPLVVQVTPHAGEAVSPQVTERSTDLIVVEDFDEGPGDYEVSYTVRGTREGHADKQVVREPDAGPGATAAGSADVTDDARVGGD